MRYRELFETKQTDTPEFRNWFADSKIVDADGNPLIVFHGTNKKFSRFSKKATPGGITWFTSNRSAIESGDVGASGSGIIMRLYASVQNPAGWDEYERLSLGELHRDGYDGVILPNKDGTFDAFVFEPSQLKKVQDAAPHKK